MSSQEFTGHVSAMRADAEFLGVEDIMGLGDVPLIIERCERHVDRKACGKLQKEMFTLRLRGSKGPLAKELWLKATNRKKLVSLYGGNVAAWKGQAIWLYVEPCKSPTGGETLGIRIRDRKDKPDWARQAEQQQTQTKPQQSRHSDSDGDMGARE